MAKTYTLQSTMLTAVRGATQDGGTVGVWGNMYSQSSTTRRLAGRSYDYFATNIRFDVSSLVGKTITDVSIRFNIIVSCSQNVPIAQMRDSSGWYGTGTMAYIPANTSGLQTISLGTTLPTYGYVIGPYADQIPVTYRYAEIDSAELLVTTNELDYTYTLSYNANQGTGGPTSQTGTNTAVSPSYTFDIPNTIPTRTGYTFAGWSDTSSGAATYSAGGTITVTQTSKTIYAVWTANEYSVSISCLDPEGSPSNQAVYFDLWYSDDQTVRQNQTSLTVTKAYGTVIYISNVRAYYSYFQISAIDSAFVDDGNGQYHYTVDETSTNKILQISTARVQYTISYNANGGTNAPANQTKYGGVDISLSNQIPTRDGYTFVKWNSASDGSGTDYNPSATYSANAAITLWAIWVASSSTLTLANQQCEAGSSILIYINKLTPDATHTLTYSIGSLSGTIVTKTSAYEVTWTVPVSVVSQIPDEGGFVSIACTTYVNDTQTGVPQAVQLAVTVPSSYQPSVSLSAAKVNSNATVAGWNILLQGYSQIQLTATATMASGATLVSYSFSGPGVSYLGSNNQVTSAVFDTYGTEPWTVTVTDSRGRTATATWDYSDYEIFAYQTPSINSASTTRTDSTGVALMGPFLKSKARLTISSCDSNNALVLHKVEYRISGASTWTLGSDTLSSDVWTAPYGSGTIDATDPYEIKFTLSDSLGNSVELTQTLNAVTGIGIGLKNDRIHLGGLPTKPGFVCDWPAEFNNTVTGIDSATIGDIYGTNYNGSYQKFDNGTMICWKTVSLSGVAISTAWGGVYESGWKSLGNWPAEFTSIPTVVATQDYDSSSDYAPMKAIKETSVSSAGSMMLWSPVSGTITTVVYNIVGIGRWK